MKRKRHNPEQIIRMLRSAEQLLNQGQTVADVCRALFPGSHRFHKSLPDCRMRRGIRFPQWWMLLVAILAILSGKGSLVGMERFSKRHRLVLNELLGTDFGKSPSDFTFRLLLAQLDVDAFEELLKGWMSAQPGVAEGLQELLESVGLAGVLVQADVLHANRPFRLPRPARR